MLIDGRSGSGKSTLATLLAAALDAQLVRLDDIYPGWDGLDIASTRVADHILDTRDPRWQRWDWASNQPAEWHHISPHEPLIIEGCGALSRANRELATFGIWLELHQATRKRRANARDGSAFDEHWQRWADQEARFAEREHPQQLADLIVDGHFMAGV